MNLSHISERQAKLMQTLRGSEGISAAALARAMEDFSLATIKREITTLTQRRLVVSSGKGRAAGYSLTKLGEFFTPIDAHAYCTEEPDKRKGFERYDDTLIASIPNSVFSHDENTILNTATEKFQERTENLTETIAQKELERFVIELSWKSSRIEGNTYTLLDTERLIREGIEAKGHTHEEAVMILNHKKAFEFTHEHKTEFVDIPSLAAVEEIHRLLTDGLNVGRGVREQVVGIVGTRYRPLDNRYQIQEAMDMLFAKIGEAKDVYTKALIALIGTSYIQPFEDGNKRTARLLGNALLLARNSAPLSYRSVDEVAYREATLVFYEAHSLVPLKEIFTSQYLFSAEQYGIL